MTLQWSAGVPLVLYLLLILHPVVNAGDAAEEWNKYTEEEQQQAIVVVALIAVAIVICICICCCCCCCGCCRRKDRPAGDDYASGPDTPQRNTPAGQGGNEQQQWNSPAAPPPMTLPPMAPPPMAFPPMAPPPMAFPPVAPPPMAVAPPPYPSEDPMGMPQAGAPHIGMPQPDAPNQTPYPYGAPPPHAMQYQP